MIRALILTVLIAAPFAQADWMSSAMNSASQSVSGSPSKNSCPGGFNEKKERADITPYDDPKSYSNKCRGGESWAECARRMFLGK